MSFEILVMICAAPIALGDWAEGMVPVLHETDLCVERASEARKIASLYVGCLRRTAPAPPTK